MGRVWNDVGFSISYGAWVLPFHTGTIKGDIIAAFGLMSNRPHADKCKACKSAEWNTSNANPAGSTVQSSRDKPTQRVGMNNCYLNKGRTWRCLVLNPSARTRAEPHNFLSLKLLNKNSNAELLEIQKDRHLLPRKGNPWQWKKNSGPAFSITIT